WRGVRLGIPPHARAHYAADERELVPPAPFRTRIPLRRRAGWRGVRLGIPPHARAHYAADDCSSAACRARAKRRAGWLLVEREGNVK
ncbi:MAG: hypothetical protein ACI4QT_08050, partial [Kiritimatiellia bacterium]